MSVNASTHDDVSVPSNPSRAAARYACEQCRGAEGLRRLDAHQRRGHRFDVVIAAGADHIGSGYRGDCAAELAGDRQRGDEHVGAGERSGGVVDDDDVDGPGLDVGGQIRSTLDSDACRLSPPSTNSTVAEGSSRRIVSCASSRSPRRNTSTVRAISGTRVSVSIDQATMERPAIRR